MDSILIVDDDLHMRNALKEAVSRLGFSPVISENGVDALSKLQKYEFSLVVTDMKMDKMDGLTLMKEVRQQIGNVPFLVITGFGTIENAIESMKVGASDYLLKPFSFDVLASKINTILNRGKKPDFIITKNEKMLKLLRIADDIASADVTVLIYGESGTGKELFAKYIHQKGTRRDKPFVAINCAAIPDNLLESEMFGYEKGAFTGAVDKKLGKFEFANSGDILLDEIGEMPITLQAKLLRVLQEKEIDRIGGKKPIPIDVRVIATTNRNLKKECEEGKFREDLYYRLNVMPLHIPPLRDRKDDIPLLAEYFLEKFRDMFGKSIEGFTDNAIDYLLNRQWRGNVRELENTIQRAVVLCKKNKIDIENFASLCEEDEQESLGFNARNIKEMEKEMIFKALEETNGNKTLAAKKLGITVRTLRNKLQSYGKNFPTYDRVQYAK